MAYGIGIDVGTTYTAAAICRADGGAGITPEAVGLGTKSTATASVVYIGDDGQWLVGDPAERRAQDRPDLVIREFKRRLGDPIPVVVAGQRYKPQAISAHVVRWVVDRVAEQEGSAAAAITITHPASWGSYKRSLMQKAIEDVGLTEASFLAEPVAAAAHYAAQARVRNGSTIAVYDLGGGTFDAAVVRKVDERSFELLGTPHGIDRLGGVDFDEAVFSHVRGSVSLPPVSPNDEDSVAAMVRLRRECTEAKEGLSADTEATIPVLLPDVHTRVRLMRAEFEDFIHDAVAETVDALRATIDSAGLAVGDVGAVLLVGGSSRIPLVAQLVSEQLERPVVVDADPKAAIALGAAVVASSRIARSPAEPKPTAPIQLARPVQTTPITSVPSRHRKIGVGAAGITAGIALVAGTAVAIVLRPESDSDRPNVVSAGDTVATTQAADDDNRSTPQSARDLLESWSVPEVPDVDVLVPSLPPFGPPVEPAPSAEEAALTATIPVVGAFPPATDPSRPASSSAPATRPSGSGSNSPSSSAAGAPSGGAGSTAQSTADSTSSDSPVLPDPTTAPPPTGTTPGGTTSSPPDTTPAPTVPPDTTPAPTDPPDTTPAPTDPPDTTPSPTDPPDTTPSPTDPPDTTPAATDQPADNASGSTSTDETQGADESAPPGTSDQP